jgi:hypothetical protein
MTKETQPTIWQTTEALTAIVRLLTIHGAMTGKVMRKFAHEVGGISNPVISSALSRGIRQGALERFETADGVVYTLPTSEDELARKTAPISTPTPPAQERAPTAPVATYRAQCERCHGSFATTVNGNFLCPTCRERVGQPLTIPSSVTTTPAPSFAAPIKRSCSCGQFFVLDGPDDLRQQCAGCIIRSRKAQEERAQLGIVSGRISTGYCGPR